MVLVLQSAEVQNLELGSQPLKYEGSTLIFPKTTFGHNPEIILSTSHLSNRFFQDVSYCYSLTSFTFVLLGLSSRFSPQTLSLFTFPIRTTFPVRPNLFDYISLSLNICFHKSRIFSLHNNITSLNLYHLS
jgi:hypothetical protein